MSQATFALALNVSKVLVTKRVRSEVRPSGRSLKLLAIEIHPWGSAIDKLEQPDRLIFDLDPGDNISWTEVIEAVHDVRDRLAFSWLAEFRQDVAWERASCRGSYATRVLGGDQELRENHRGDDGKGKARPLCRHRSEARTPRAHFC
jgi:hypothetical protein